MSTIYSLQKGIEALGLAGTKHKIIIGVDYGTTFSGVSYATTEKNNTVNIISNWPKGNGTNLKTPTRIAYQEENPGLQSNKWGFAVLHKFKSYSWTKLLLDNNAKAEKFDDPALSNMTGRGMMKLPKFRDAQGVCEDFLREVYGHVLSNIHRQIPPETFDATPIECWITLPAIWSEEAKAATLEAAKKAGFASRNGDEIFTIAEPEAAAITALKQYSQDDALNPIKPNDHILICDCGGGTVDITTYTIVQVEPHLEFDELCIGIGGKCGSTYIDRNFHEFLSNHFGKAFDKIPDAQKGPGSNLMTEFETAKRDFGTDEDEGDIEIGGLQLDVEDSEHYDIVEDKILLTHLEMQSLFDPVIKQILGLVGQQVKEARSKHHAKIDRIILVGGFGESVYLNRVLQEWCREHGGIKLICPSDPQAAIVRGATLRGLEGITAREKKARRHYGISLGEEFEEGLDPESKAYIDPFDDEKRCDGRMSWLLSKRDIITKDTVRTIDCFYSGKYFPEQSTTRVLTLYSTNLDKAPRYSDDSGVEEVGSIVSEFPSGFLLTPIAKTRFKRKGRDQVYKFDFQVQIRFGDKGENLIFKNLVGGKTISSAILKFDGR